MNALAVSALDDYLGLVKGDLELLNKFLVQGAALPDLLHSLSPSDRDLLMQVNEKWRQGFGTSSGTQVLLEQRDGGCLLELLWLTIIYRILGGCPGLGYEQNRGELRRHSLAVGLISHQLSQFYPGEMGRLFCASLIHDIGKAALYSLVHTHDREIRRLIQDTQCSFTQIEQEVLGLTHAQAGALILEDCGFDSRIVEGVRLHHNPDGSGDHLTHFISLADTIAMTLGFSTNLDCLKYPAPEALYRKYHIGKLEVQIVARDAVDGINRMIPFFLGQEGG